MRQFKQSLTGFGQRVTGCRDASAVLTSTGEAESFLALTFFFGIKKPHEKAVMLGCREVGKLFKG